MAKKEIELLNRFLIKECAVDGNGTFSPYHIQHKGLNEYWEKDKLIKFVLLLKNQPIFVKIYNKSNNSTELDIWVPIHPKGYSYEKMTEKEYKNNRGNTIVGGKITGVLIDKHKTHIEYQKDYVELFEIKKMNSFNAKIIIKELSRFTSKIEKTTKLIEFLIEDMPKNPKKYARTIAYG